jgi:hypothetical protein
MRRRAAWKWAWVAAILLVMPGAGGAAIQGKDRVYWLGAGDWQLREVDGEVCLVESRLPRKDWSRDDQRHPWSVSAPTIKSAGGKFLSGDPEGRDPSVRLVAEKGPHTRWVFEFVDRLSPGRSEEESGRFKEGPAGFTFRVKLDEGPFKGWYLAAGDAVPAPKEGPGKKPPAKRLRLVRGAREATVFTYVEENYFVDHK